MRPCIRRTSGRRLGAPTLLPSGGSDDNTLVRVLEIVFGIAAGLSVVTLFFALRRRA
jgi:hypothetical protein